MHIVCCLWPARGIVRCFVMAYLNIRLKDLKIKEGDSDGISGSICNKCSKVRNLSGDHRRGIHLRCQIEGS